MKRLLPAVLAVSLALWILQPLSAFAAVDPQDSEFQSYLTEIGMTEEEFVTYFEEFHGFTLEDFDSVQELKDYLGETITEENLKVLLEYYELSRKELEQLLAENGMSLSDFIFIDDLEFELLDLTADSIDEDELIQALAEFGITKEEAEKLGNHIARVLENADGEAFLAKLENLGERLMAFPEFDSSSDLTPAQIAELMKIWDELLDLLELKVEYYLVKNGIETPISLSALIQMDTVDGADLLIKIYSKDGEFLADILITKEMFGSDIIHAAGQKVNKAENAYKATGPSAKPVMKTVKGGELPNTASDYIPQAAAGLVMIMLGVLLFRRLKIGA